MLQTFIILFFFHLNVVRVLGRASLEEEGCCAQRYCLKFLPKQTLMVLKVPCTYSTSLSYVKACLRVYQTFKWRRISLGHHRWWRKTSSCCCHSIKRVFAVPAPSWEEFRMADVWMHGTWFFYANALSILPETNPQTGGKGCGNQGEHPVVVYIQW